tara:strand:+ start:125 stop:1612 length:1488 start_codon:yes stop_codon:yes gene_type:complete
MGILLKQSFWSSLIIYIGVLIGFINSLILFPKYLKTEEIGLLRQIISAATLLLPLAAFGISGTSIKFYPEFSKDVKSKNEFFSFQFLLTIIGLFLVLILTFIFNKELINFFSKKSELITDYFDIIFFILFLLTLSTIFESYLKSRMHIILPNFTNGVLNRIFTGFSVLLLSVSIINFHQMIYLQVPIYSIGVLILIFYSYKKEKFTIDLNFIKIKNKINSILNFNIYSLISGFGNIIILNIDILMISALLGLSDTGIYTTAFYIAIIIEMPRRAVSQISTPILSKLFKENNLKSIKNYYKIVSINQLIIGSLLFLLVISNLENIFNLIPNKDNFIKGISIVPIICIAKLITMSSSFGSELILMSKHYKFSVTSIIILAIITVISNYFLIPIYGINGAAYAALLSSIIFNLIKIIFIYYKYRFLPFSIKSVYVIIITIITFLIIYFLPSNQNYILDILFKSFFIMIFFVPIIYLFKVSIDLNKLIDKFFNSNNPKS